MPNFILSPNMNLPIPVVGVDPGPDYASNVNSSLSAIDSHSHTPGSGVLITPAAIDINSDFTFSNNNATNLLSARFFSNSTPLSDPSDINSIYVSLGDLYYNDAAGNQVRMTNGGSVAGPFGTITGLPSGTASAAYISGTFVFQEATLTAANIDAGSYIFRNNIPSSFGLTLQPPNPIGADYSVTLPPPNTLGGLGILTYDVSNNIGFLTPDGVAAQITVTGADAIAAQMDATGAASIASVMSPTSADVIAVKITATGANSIAGAMTSTGADSIASKITSTGTTSIAATMTSANANTIRNKETRGFALVNGGVGDIAFSNPVSNVITGTGALATITLSTVGRPVMVYFMSDRNVFPNEAQISSSGNAVFQLRNNNSGQVCGAYNYQPNNGSAVMPLVFVGIDNPAAGAQAYTIEVTAAAGTTVVANYMIMAYEL